MVLIVPSQRGAVIVCVCEIVTAAVGTGEGVPRWLIDCACVYMGTLDRERA